MKIARPPHNWSVSPREAIAIQKRLAGSARQTKPTKSFRYVAGVDAAYSVDGKYCLAGVVLLDMVAGEVVEHHTASRSLNFPYIPGLLTFREAPAILVALRKLELSPDCLMCDGQGVAHPRGCGIATHLGIIAGLPGIGCAKSRLIGDYRMPAAARGSRSSLTFNGEIIGAVLRTRSHVKPLFVSVGNNIDLDTAVHIVLTCGRGFRLPEPTRLADQLVGSEKRRLAKMMRSSSP